MILSGLSPYPLLLLVAVIVASFLPVAPAYQPLNFFRFFARQLAAKVNPRQARSRQQQRISGLLAVIVAMLPLLAILYALYMLSELPYMLDVLLLYFCLDWSNVQQQANRISHNLQRQQLTLAREQSKILLLRNTSRLTSMGLSKACIESLLLRYSRLQLGVLFWFLLGGGLVAVSYRLLAELNQQWNTKLPANRDFGATAAILTNLAAAPAMLISSILLACQSGIKPAWQLYRQSLRQYFPWLQYMLLLTGSAALQCTLGGPLYYTNQQQEYKLARCRLGLGSEPGPSDINRCLALLTSKQNLFLMLIAMFSLIQLLMLVLGLVDTGM